MFVAAHPDDDTFAIARSIALHAADPDLRFVLVIATDGEAGVIAPGVDATPETLGSVRRTEDEASWRIVGRMPDRHEWLGLPDGGLPEVGFDDLVDRIHRIMIEESPDVVGTFGPDGITGHPDHVVVGAATTAAFHRAREAGAAGFRRLLHSCIAESDIARWNANLREAGQPEWQPDQPYHLRGVPDAMIAISVDTRSVAALAVAAIRAHTSQWSPEVVSPGSDELVRSLRTEDWVIAWPESPEGVPRLGGIFEGLDSG
jgi:N-acetyl-1-D-myo-inositol-2-amino-2-deoxy-alpha-D-glucopyranoside deacetylase